MSYYHLKRADAQAVADALPIEDSRIAYAKVELVENNGWVVVVVPNFYQLAVEYGDRFEVRNPISGARLSPRPADHRRYVPIAGVPRAAGMSRGPQAKLKPRVEVVRTLVVKPVAGGLALPWATPAPAAAVTVATAGAGFKKPWEK